MLRTPKCSRCRNHGFLVPVKGHVGKCRWKQCTCEKCYLITQRHKIMAAQKGLKKQASEEEHELASGAMAVALAPSLHPLPQVAASEDAEPGPEGRVAACLLERPPRGPSPGPEGPAAACLLERPPRGPSPGPEGPAAACLLERPPQGPSPGPEGPAAACLLERPPQGPSPGLSAFQPVLGGRGHMGLSERAAVAVPSLVGLQLGVETAGRGGPGFLELRRPIRPMPSPPFADFGLPLSINLDHAVGSEYLEREPFKLYPSCSSMHSYNPFPLGYQDASPGIPLHWGFRHVSYNHYHGGGLMSEPEVDFQPNYYQLPLPPTPPPPPPLLQPLQPLQPPFLPPGFLSALHFLPPLPPPPLTPPSSFSLTIMSDEDKETTDDQDAEVPREPNQASSQEQSD